MKVAVGLGAVLASSVAASPAIGSEAGSEAKRGHADPEKAPQTERIEQQNRT
jgi:hypothetical protein